MEKCFDGVTECSNMNALVGKNFSEEKFYRLSYSLVVICDKYYYDHKIMVGID
jgi:hypothetical protein